MEIRTMKRVKLAGGASRRDFLTTSAVAAASATLASLAPSVHAAGSDVLRVGLVGCGGRGTGAAAQALRADPHTELVALGDMFEDRLKGCLKELQGDANLANRIKVPDDRCFTGFDAYKQVIPLVDVVLLATPPHFRPLHLRAAVDANKHVFVEKPVAVDAPGVRSILATCEAARKKNLSIVSGLCWRYHHGMRDTFRRVHDGTIGEITALQCSYNTGALWHRDREKGWSDMEWQLRNWLYFTWLSGDFNVEQHIHSLDKMAWAMRDEYPIKASGMGGRQTRTDPVFGHIFDHHAVVYEYAGGVKLFATCRQQIGCQGDVSDHIMGTKGVCHIDASHGLGRIVSFPGSSAVWSSAAKKRKEDDMYQNEHNEFFASIRSGKPINNGDYMAKSTLMAIMGRMATYTGQLITWDMAMNSQEDLTPPRYAFGPLPVAPVARPGVTKFV
jgi:predicted dehydrogenase